MSLIHRPIRAGAVAVLGLAMTALTGAVATSAMAAGPAAPAPSAAAPHYVALTGSVTPTRATVTGSYISSRMSVEVALKPTHEAELNALIRALYTKGSGSYRHWLARGQFDVRYAPTARMRAAVARYLARSGLAVQRSSSPFLVRASGSSQHVSAAFRTTLSTYRNARGSRFFANSTAVSLPSTLAGGVLGVIGLTNMVREHDMAVRAKSAVRPAGSQPTSAASCETPYPTDAQLFNQFNNGVTFMSGYAGGPGCSGLTPSQTNSIYGAPHVGPAGQGAGVTLAVFELSAYLKSDISTWAHTFYGPGFNPPLRNVTVDGGTLNPVCPAGDTCPPEFQGYAGDIEVDADIETQLAISPDVHQIIVYEAPNDFTGQTTVDLYTKIANDDTADAVSSSWGECENDIGTAVAQAENVAFEQMAMQGQSMFASAGDDGAFDCLGTDGTSVVNVDDPEAQPWVTSVGGTSLESDNPGTDPTPSYPDHVETVWNVANLCNTSSNEGGDSGIFWCAATGAGGGGSSEFWGRPFYQHGPGINNPFTTSGCAFAPAGTPCREVPDISANADQYTPYAEYCTGNANTVNSVCATFSGGQNPPGWFGIGGTSLSSPLWSGIAADRDSYQGFRSGNFNPLLYLLYDTAPSQFFHDITGVGPLQATATTNGLFPTTPGYDEATGIGTPKMGALITESS
jgi:subtilase family serine protease